MEKHKTPQAIQWSLMSEREFFDWSRRLVSVFQNAHLFRNSYNELPPLLDSGERWLAFAEYGCSAVLHNTEYTLSILLSLSKNGIKSSNSESVISSNHDCTGTWETQSIRMVAATLENSHKASNTNRVIRMKYIWGRRIIYNYNLMKISA